MRFLVDQDVFAATVRFLRSLGHDAILVSEIGLAQASDEKLLQIAQELERILVTRDRDYGTSVCQWTRRWRDLSAVVAI